ncbi:MAG: acetylornithine deacetylase [Alphaproteobacteria bacterium]|nr:acetylornithine deacetylase [Alphaproteobacteria bacterium]
MPAPAAIDLLRTLIGFDTTSRDSNLALIGFIADYLGRHGVAARILPSADGAKANLLATIGPRRPGGIVLSGHSDVVPVDGQPWTSDPFTLTERDGKLFGRGTCDMKTFIALALAQVPDMVAKDLRLPIHLAFSYDEEVGCLGVPALIERIVAEHLEPRAVIVGEPTEMTVVNAHKGIHAFRTTVTGVEAHSSAPQLGVNAIVHAAELIAGLGAIASDIATGPVRDERFVPPTTTIQIGKIEGGTALNIVPRQCKFLWEFRLLPGHDPDDVPRRFATLAADVQGRMRVAHPGAAIETQTIAHVPPLKAEHGSPAETLVLALAGSNRVGAVSFGTEAGLFQAAECPTVVCGPGSIEQAHKPDEFITLEQVAAGEAFLTRLIDFAARG